MASFKKRFFVDRKKKKSYFFCAPCIYRVPNLGWYRPQRPMHIIERLEEGVLFHFDQASKIYIQVYNYI